MDAIIEAIADTLSKREKITLVGFGTFQVMQRKASRGVNPQTREVIQIHAEESP